MRARAVAAVLAVLLVSPSIADAQSRARPTRRETSIDVRRPDAAIRARAARLEAAAAVSPAAGVGDPDFGRNVRFLGVAQTLSVVLLPDCSGSSPEYERCITVPAGQEPIFFQEGDLARIDLPAKAASSLVCFTLTPFMTFAFSNGTGVPQPNAEFTAWAEITVENSVLEDPALVDPFTGEPLGGKLRLGLGTYDEWRSLAVDEFAYKHLSMSRACIGGLLSKEGLTGIFGLSEDQAMEFFRRPTTLRLGSIGYASLVGWADYFYGLRLYGD